MIFALYPTVCRSGRLLGGLVLLVVISSWVLACKYSVRDVGFVDLQASDYRLWLIPPDSQTGSPREVSGEASAWLAVARAVLVETNVEPAVVERSELAMRWPAQASVPVEVGKWLDSGSSDGRLRSLLISPDGQAWYPLEWAAAPSSSVGGNGLGTPSEEETERSKATSPLSGELATDLWWDDLERLVDSPLRQQLLDQMLGSHCLVLVLEGSDADGNQRAREVAQRAIDRSERWLADLPKAAAGPPRMHVVTAEQRRQEILLMWSLGVDRISPGEPSVAATAWEVSDLSGEEMLAGVVVLFGRLRPMGPPIFDPLLTAVEIGERMQLVGADCECGLDRSWMQGRMAVHRWDDDRRQAAAQSLGFDAENTMVKVEISRILARGGSAVGVAGGVAGRSGQPPSDGYNLPDLGYSERVIGGEPDSDRQSLAALGQAPSSRQGDAGVGNAGMFQAAANGGEMQVAEEKVLALPAASGEDGSGANEDESEQGLRWLWWMMGGLVLASLLGGGCLWLWRPGG